MKGVGAASDRTTGEIEYVVSKTDDGWRYTGKLLQAETLRNERPFDQPVDEILGGLEIALVVGNGGDVTSVHGYDQVTSRLHELFPATVAEKLEPTLGSEALAARALEDWYARVGDFVGLTVSIGDLRTQTAPYLLPNGNELMSQVETRFAGWEKCPPGRCIRIETHYDSEAAAAIELGARLATAKADPVADAVADPATASAQAGVAPADAASADAEEASTKAAQAKPRLVGNATRIIDPTTMLIYSESQEKTVSVEMQIEGLGPVALTVVETQVYSYEYEQ